MSQTGRPATPCSWQCKQEGCSIDKTVYKSTVKADNRNQKCDRAQNPVDITQETDKIIMWIRRYCIY